MSGFQRCESLSRCGVGQITLTSGCFSHQLQVLSSDSAAQKNMMSSISFKNKDPLKSPQKNDVENTGLVFRCYYRFVTWWCNERYCSCLKISLCWIIVLSSEKQDFDFQQWIKKLEVVILIYNQSIHERIIHGMFTVTYMTWMKIID